MQYRKTACIINYVMRVDEFVVRIKEYQAGIGITDKAFSDAIGLEPSRWCKIKQGKLNPTVPFLQGLWRAFPSAHDIIITYLDGGKG